ncbi:MAG: hypothetical protein HRT70_07550 [Flavobacteriaceae bacterium]|nr:hypothetical protein [Flavobacteriaceae bacterium]
MRTILEKGDKVKVKDDWRDWKKGEIAIIKKWNKRPTPLHNDSYTLEPTNGTIKDFHVLRDYMLEPLQ